jgi:hypothetical protein
MWPLHGFAVVAVLNCLLWFRVGHYPRSRWRVDTEGVPFTLLTLLGHTPDVRFRATAALARIALYAMVLPCSSYLVDTPFHVDLRSRHLTERIAHVLTFYSRCE